MKQLKAIKRFERTIDIGLFLCGSMTTQNILYSTDDLEQQKKLDTVKFSVYDNHENNESRDVEEGTGFWFSSYLNIAGVVEKPEDIRLRSVDGFETVVSELLSRRYYFPKVKECDPEGKESRDVFVSFYKNGKKAKFYPHPTIMFGQQGLDDQNKDYFAKGLQYAIVGNKEPAFWAKGDGLCSNRYFTIDQIFGLQDTTEYEQVTLSYKNGLEKVVPMVRLEENFWTKELARSGKSDCLKIVDTDGTLYDPDLSAPYYLFFTDTNLKKVGLWNGENIILSFAGFLLGEIPPSAPKEVRIPSEKEQGDFFVRVKKDGQELADYQYSFRELQETFKDLMEQDVFEYYNHNLNNGKGANRKVTGKGWRLDKLLLLLPEIPDQEMLESGGVLFQIHTNDTYKEKQATEGSELTAYHFMLTAWQDQRSISGLEKGDNSNWDDAELRFEPITGKSLFRIYCTKTNANPAVYKNACGMTVELL